MKGDYRGSARLKDRTSAAGHRDAYAFQGALASRDGLAKAEIWGKGLAATCKHPRVSA